jgi:hypothetical protein
MKEREYKESRKRSLLRPWVRKEPEHIEREIKGNRKVRRVVAYKVREKDRGGMQRKKREKRDDESKKER